MCPPCPGLKAAPLKPKDVAPRVKNIENAPFVTRSKDPAR
jgi:hypothetical protein